jgi:hypothetical protein
MFDLPPPAAADLVLQEGALGPRERANARGYEEFR